jgi:hypothetical protein
MTLSRGGLICQILGQCLVIIIHQSDASILAIFLVRRPLQVLQPTIYLIKGGLICQRNVGTATLRWGGTYSEGGTYMPVYTVLVVTFSVLTQRVGLDTFRSPGITLTRGLC